MPQVVRKHIVARCLSRLRQQKTHTLFAGYLCLQQRVTEVSRLDDLQPDFLSFFKKFFLVGNHPLGTPYIKPFTEQKPSDRNLWLNENVAGSYAPSSLRVGQPFREVVILEERNYSLPIDHAQRAFDHLLYAEKIEVAALSVFLYRDYGLLTSTPTIHDFVNIFAFEFGYTSELGGQLSGDFHTLYNTDLMNNWDNDWLESL